MNRGNRLLVQLTTIYIYILLTLYLFYCGADGYQGVLRAKFPLFCVICGGYILAMGILGIECILVGDLKLPALSALWRRAGWTRKFALVYLILTWFSALASPYWPETVVGVSRREGALTITIYVLCFLLVSALGRVTVRTLAVLCLSVSGFGGLCILQLAGWNPFSLYPAGYRYADAYSAYSGAYLGTIGNVDLVAAFLCIVIPILWVGFVRLNGRVRGLLLVPLAVSVLVLLKMSVLAGLVGVFGGGILMIPVVIPLRHRRAIAAVLLLAALFCAVLAYRTDPGTGLFHELHDILHGNWDDTFGSGRVHIWKRVLERIPQRLCLGAGPDTMLYAAIDPFTRYDESLGGLIVSQIDVAHNEYLNILFHQGVFALAAYLLTLGSAAWKWIQASPTDPVCAMLGGAAFCYCIQAFFSFSMCVTAPFFWLALALLESRTLNQNGERKLCGKNLSA